MKIHLWAILFCALHLFYLPAQASVFSLDARLSSTNKIGLPPYTDADNKSLGLLQLRINPNIEWQLSKDMTFKFTPQYTTDAWIYGTASKSKPHRLRNEKLLLQEISFDFETSVGRLYFGQIPLVFGSQSLLGDGYYYNRWRSFPGVLYTLPLDLNSLTVLYAAANDDSRLRRLRSGSSPRIGGIYYKGFPDYIERLDLYILSLQSKEDVVGQKVFQSLSSGARILIDGRFWNLSFEGIFQSNEDLGIYKNEGYLSLQYDYKIFDQSKLGFSFNIASEMFHPYYRNAFITYGEMKNFSPSNLSDLSLNYKLNLSEKLRLFCSLHHFQRIKNESSIYNSDYTSLINAGLAGLNESHVGDELNISLEKKWHSLISEFGIGIFKPGSYFKTDTPSTPSISVWGTLNWSINP